MKTTYQKPTTEMIILNVQQMVCASGEGSLLGNGATPNNLDLGDAGKTNETGNNLSRFNVWGDDDEE